MEKRGEGRTFLTWIGWALFAIVAAANLLVLRQHRVVQNQLSEINGSEVAERLLSAVGVTPDGRASQIRLDDGQRHLVFTYARNCQYCQATLPHWKRLASNLDRTQWSVIWISRDPVEATRAFVEDHDITDAVLTEVSYRTYAQLGLARVPRTIAIGADGLVAASILGALDSSNSKTLEALVGNDEPAPNVILAPPGR